MNTKIKIPKGWRKLRLGETVKEGEYYVGGGELFKCYGLIGVKVGKWGIDTTTSPYIRRIKKGKK